jgi:hypothetical protein
MMLIVINLAREMLHVQSYFKKAKKEVSDIKFLCLLTSEDNDERMGESWLARESLSQKSISDGAKTKTEVKTDLSYISCLKI